MFNSQPRTSQVLDGPELKISKYAIIGEYAADGPARFVKHAAIVRQDCKLLKSAPIEVWHSGPPIVAGALTSPSPGHATCKSDIVGDLCLTTSETEAIDDWLATVEKEICQKSLKPFEQYTILPHMKWHLSEEGRRTHRRFSCAGFVIEAYQSSNISLLSSELPLADEEQLATAYRGLFEIEKREKRIQDYVGFKGRSDLGLTAAGPWPIALPGYLFHSTERATILNRRPAPLTPSGIEMAFYPRKDGS